MGQSSLIKVSDLTIRLNVDVGRQNVVEGVSLDLFSGETLCLVGESGSGKSLTSRAILGLLPEYAVSSVTGRILFEGRNLLDASEIELQRVRGRSISMIFQEPMTALNPVKRIGEQIGELFRIHTNLTAAERNERVLELLKEVNIPDPAAAAHAYPHELSGGQRQRAMIAMALSLSPKVILADEPTTALDVTTQAQILKLLRELRAKHGSTVLFVTHDFGVVAEVADRVAVMRNGRIVETGAVHDILTNPQDDYTKALLAAIPTGHRFSRASPSEGSLVRVEGLTKTFSRSRGILRLSSRSIVKAVNDVSLEIPRGRTVGIVGESGSGKSTLARLIMRLVPPNAGHVYFEGVDLLQVSSRKLRSLRKSFQVVFQDPYASLNPRKRVEDIVAQGPRLHGVSAREARARARRLLELVELPPGVGRRFPHEFSGGQRQRIAIARALALEPKLLIADEAVSALDVSVQAQILDMLRRIQKELGVSVIFVTHDLRVAAQICDEIVVMHQGTIVERGEVQSVLKSPKHSYTRLLLDSLPGRELFPLFESGASYRATS